MFSNGRIFRGGNARSGRLRRARDSRAIAKKIRYDRLREERSKSHEATFRGFYEGRRETYVKGGTMEFMQGDHWRDSDVLFEEF